MMVVPPHTASATAMVIIARVRWLFIATLPLCVPVHRPVVVWAAALHCACSAASGGNAAGEFYVDGAGETLPMVCTRGAIIAQVCQPEAGIVLNDERKGGKQSHVGKYSLVMARVSTLSHYPNVGQKDTFWTATTFFCGDMQKSPVFSTHAE